MKKRFLTLGLAAALTLSLSACAGAETEPADKPTESAAAEEAPKGDQLVYLVSKGFQHQFWQAVKKGAEEEGKALGVKVEFVGPPKESDVSIQVNQLETALAAKPIALGFAALDAKAAIPVLQKFKDAKIPVIGFDSGVESDIPVATAATDNLAAAALAAEKLSGLIGGAGKVAIVCHDQTSTTGKERVKGFVDYMKEKVPGVELLEPQFGGGDHAKSADIAKNVITANPDLKGYYGCNEGSAVGVAKGVKEAGKVGAVTVVGFDSGEAQMNYIKDGTMAGAVTQDPEDIGRQTVKAGVAAAKGEAVEAKIGTNFAWYDKSNIDDAKIVPMLYK